MTSSQSALVGNGRLLVSLDGRAGLLGASWPHIDSFNQLGVLEVHLPGSDLVQRAEQTFLSDLVVETRRGSTTIRDEVLPDHDVWIRTVDGDAGDPLLLVAPRLDGRTEDQTLYFDEVNQVLFAYHRGAWVAIASDADVLAWQCSVGAPPPSTDPAMRLSGERIASRTVHGFLRVRGGSPVRFLIAFAGNREAALASLAAAGGWVDGRTDGRVPADPLAAQSRNVIRLLTSADTGAVLAGPPLEVDIASEPGYAAVWGRDAAWIELGSLAAGDHERVRRFLEFAFRVQAPEGLWLHRYHTDYSLGSSWGLHQLDETGIILHLLACYATQSGDWAFAAGHAVGVENAARFLLNSIGPDGLPLPSVDLWEERESQSAYTVASVIGGLRAGALIFEEVRPGAAEIAQWREAADRLADEALTRFWAAEHGRFVKAVHSRDALQLDDPTRTDLAATLDAGGRSGQATPLPQYPNWTSGPPRPVDLTYDISVLGLAVPFGIVPVDDPRMVETMARLAQRLWNEDVGGYRRYEGDTYGGGNPWPVATLWVACWEAARGNTTEATRLLDWVREHVGPNNMIAEQVHRSTGAPVAALPMAWSHGMVLLTIEAINGRRVWEPDPQPGFAARR